MNASSLERRRVVAFSYVEHVATQFGISAADVLRLRGRATEARVEVFRRLQALGWSTVEIGAALGKHPTAVVKALGRVVRKAEAAE